MADGVNAFTVYSSLELQINEFVQQLNRASQILDQTLQNMSGAVSSLNMPAVEVRTEANTGAVHDVENAVNGINVPPVTVHTETEPLEQVTVPPPDDRTFLQKIRDGFNNLKNTINSIPSNIAGKFREMGTNIVSTFRSFPSDVASKFREMKNSAVERIKSLPSDIAGIITSVPSKIGSGLKTIGTNISNAFKSGVENAKNALKELPEKASEALKETGEKLKGIAEKVAKAGTVAVGAVSAGIGAFTKSSLDSYAGYEQLIGGVETLFKDSADKIQEYADNAYKTSGLSANDYMETVTGFSASLLQSLGGDTAKSADIADMAVRDMSDNANKMGTAMENIQNAYQGFAKQNYTMLDNLKLGYGGTTREMARLINDSGVLGDALIDLDDTQALSLHIEEAGGYATIIEAIHAVQTQMDITGTTAKEASSTIEGSVATMKSAWKNLTVEIAKDNGNIDELISYFVESAETALNNILPRIETIFSGIGKLIEKFVPLAVDKLPDIISTVLPSVISSATLIVAGIVSAITKSIPKLANSAVQLLKGFAKNISKNAPTAIKGFSDMLKKVADWIKKNGKTLITAGMSMVKSIAKGISENLPDMIGSVTEVIAFIGETISENLGDLLDSGLEILESIGQGIFDNLPKLVGTAFDIVTSLGEYLIEKIPVLTEKAPEIVESLATALSECGDKMVTVADELITKFADAVGLSEQWEEIKTSVKGAVDNISASFDDMKKSLQPLKDAFDKLKDKIFGTKDETGLLKKGFDRLCDTVSKTIDVIGKAISGIMDFVTWLNSGTTGAYVLKTAIEAVATAISITLIGGAIKGLIAQLPVLLGYIVAQTSALVANAAAWIAAAAPILGIVTAISAVIFVGKLLIENWDEIKTFCIGVWNEMQDRLMAFWENLDIGWHTIWQSISDFFNERIDDLKTGWQSIINFFKERIDDLSVGIQSIKDFFASLRDHIHNIFGAIGRFISGLVDNWKSGVQSIKDGVENVIEKVKGIPDAFGELVDSALNWGRDLIENFMQGAKEKIEAWNSFWEEVGFTIYDILHHSTPEKGPLKDDDKWGGDLMDNLINGVKSKKKELSDTIKGVAENIKETFEKPVSVSTDITADGRFNRLKVPDISAVAENIYTVKSAPAESAMQKNSPVVVESLIINVEGKKLSSEYEMEKFINMVADRLQARNIIKSRGVGGVFS